MSSAAQATKQMSPIAKYFHDFKVLLDNPREFWAVQGVNFLDSTAYFSMISIVSLFLTGNLQMSDVHAGYTVTAFTTFVTLCLFVSGFITDSLGIKKSLIISQVIQMTSRVGLVICGFAAAATDTPSPLLAWGVVGLLVLGAPGMAMTQTVFQSANKRFSSKRSRSASFNMWYLLMNLGGVAGGLAVDLVRKALEIDLTYIFVLGAVAAVISFLTALVFVHREAQVSLDDDEREAEAPAEKKSGLEIAKEVVRESAFWRFIVLMVLLLGVRSVFAYMYLLMPLYWERVIEAVSGEKTNMGLLQALNPVLIVIGLILFIPLANKFNVFKMLVFGAMVSAISMVFLVIPWSSGFGISMPTYYFLMSVAMLSLLSIGEVFWSPKLTEYTAAIAPEGQEGSYLGLSMMPWFVAKLAVSGMSGHMLTRWVPEGIGAKMQSGELSFWDRPEMMWLILMIWALSGPLIALTLKGWLTKGADLDPVKEEEDAPEVADEGKLVLDKHAD